MSEQILGADDLREVSRKKSAINIGLEEDASNGDIAQASIKIMLLREAEIEVRDPGDINFNLIGRAGLRRYELYKTYNEAEVKDVSWEKQMRDVMLALAITAHRGSQEFKFVEPSEIPPNPEVLERMERAEITAFELKESRKQNLSIPRFRLKFTEKFFIEFFGDTDGIERAKAQFEEECGRELTYDELYQFAVVQTLAKNAGIDGLFASWEEYKIECVRMEMAKVFALPQDASLDDVVDHYLMYKMHHENGQDFFDPVERFGFEQFGRQYFEAFRRDSARMCGLPDEASWEEIGEIWLRRHVALSHDLEEETPWEEIFAQRKKTGDEVNDVLDSADSSVA